MGFCIPIDIAEKLKAAARNGEIKMADLFNMKDSAMREALFEKYVDKATAKAIVTGFEKAMVSSQKNAMETWLRSTFTAEQKKTPKYNDIHTRIQELDKLGVLTPEATKTFTQNLIAEKLGATVTETEAKTISDKASVLSEKAAKLSTIGDYTDNPKGQMEYFKAKRDMEDYLDSLNPSGQLKVLTSTIARGNMLMRIGSILVNINSNNWQGITESIVRRFETRAITGANTQEMGKLLKFQTDIFRETGFDLTRMTSLESDRKILGQDITNSQGKGLVRKIGRMYEDFVFKLTQGLPDVAAASIAFGDRSNLLSTKIAYGEKLTGEQAKTRALEIFKDAASVEPKTEEGKAVRQQAIMDAERSTNTDSRVLAEKALGLRKLLNVGDLKFGDMNIPFVKTTANAIQSSLEASGITIPLEVTTRLIKTIKLVQQSSESGYKAWGEASKEAFSGFGSTMVRAGLGTTAAWLVANAIKPDDYVGVYPTSAKEQELLRLKNATPNSVKIGGRWISLDWFGPMFAPMVGMMNAKKYGKTFNEQVYYFATGAGYQVLKTPGIDYLKQTIDKLTTTLQASSSQTIEQTRQDVGNFLVDFVQSRFIPGIVSVVAGMTDDVVRDVNAKNDILAPLKNAIPGARQTLPEKKNVFGETTLTDPFTSLFFGSRVKKSSESDPVINELSRLSNAGQLPSIASVAKTSPRAKDLKVQIGDEKFYEAMTRFGKAFKNNLESLIQNPAYKNASDEKKKQTIESIKDKLFEQTLVTYGYKKPTK